MKYIIMADGKGSRWKNYRDIPKHFIEVNGETIIGRCVRLIKEGDPEAEVIITSHDERYDIKGARRYEPLNNNLEVDRFTEELIEDEVCFLYGDTYYSQEAIKLIQNTCVEDVLFFGTKTSIVCVKVKKGSNFKKHVDNVRTLFLEGKISKCIGWQVYQSYAGLPFGEKQIGRDFILIEDRTEDFNSPEDYHRRFK